MSNNIDRLVPAVSDSKSVITVGRSTSVGSKSLMGVGWGGGGC